MTRRSGSKHRTTVFYIDPMSMRNLARYDFHLLEHLVSDVYYFCSRHYDYKPLPNVQFRKVFRYNQINSIALKTASYLLSYLLVLFHTLRIRPDVVHIQWCKLPQADSLYMWLTKKFIRARIVFTVHNVLPHNTGLRYKNIYSRIYNKMADAIIVHSARTKDEITSQFDVDPAKIHVINHGIIPMERETDNPSTPDYYKQFEGRFIITSLGEQSHYKGIDMLADVWLSTPQLRRSGDLMLIIAGKNKGINLSELSLLDNVYLKDEKISDDEYIRLLRLTDVYVLPYRDISQSGALLTLMAEHIPVAVTDVGGLTDPFQYGNIGWIIPKPTREALRDTLLHIVANKEEARNIKADQATWQTVCSHYAWDLISRQTQQLYENLAQ